MASNNRTLYQFPLSLYCEKTRWNLDAKGLAYTCRDLLPGAHTLTAWRLARQRSLPVLRDGQHSIGDSTRIALYLDDHYPTYPLLPVDPAARQQILQLEDWFDELGEHVRRYCWSLAVDSPEVSQIFFGFQGYGRWQQGLATLSKPLLRQMIRRTFQVYPAQVAHSEARLADAVVKLDALLHDTPERYLVGDRFSLADLTAASMLAPLVGPPHSPWADSRLPSQSADLRSQIRATLAGQWVLRLYRDHRPALPVAPILADQE